MHENVQKYHSLINLNGLLCDILDCMQQIEKPIGIHQIGYHIELFQKKNY